MPKEKYHNFVRKSEEFFDSAFTATESEHWSVAVANAAISGINLVSALTTFHLGLQATAEDCRKGPELLRKLGLREAELDVGLKHIRPLFHLESLSETSGPGFRNKEALAAMEHLRKLRTWTLAKLPPDV